MGTLSHIVSCERVLLRVLSLQQDAFEDDDCMIVDVPKTPPRVIDVTEDDDDEFKRGVKKLKVNIPLY